MNRGKLFLGLSLIALAVTIFFVTTATDIGSQFGVSSEDGANMNTTEKVEGVHSILADGIVDVRISKGEKEEVRYEYHSNEYKNNSNFDDGVLKINFSSLRSGFRFFNLPKSSEVKVFVTVKSLERIEMDGIGSVKTTNMIEADDLNISNRGTGSMTIAVQGNMVTADNEGIGSLNLSGSAQNAEIRNDGVGSVKAADFKVEVLKAINEGVGSLNVYAAQEISLVNSGVGSIRYTGDANVKSMDSQGIGSVSKY